MEDLQDVTESCVGCGDPFVVTVGEQRFLLERFGEQYRPPRRCRPCRARKKAEKAEQGGERR